MIFNSYIVILAFLPCVVLGYYLLAGVLKGEAGVHASQLFLIAASFVFYAYSNPSYLLILLGSIFVNYALSRLIIRFEATAKIVTAIGVLLNIAVLGYYKYFDFFAENFGRIMHVDFTLRHLILPLGISFFTFQQISYLVDSYKGETKYYGFREYALFVSFFPQLVAGPIVLHKEMIPQLRDASRRRIDWDYIGLGITRFSVGLFKKSLIADTLSGVVNAGFAAYNNLNSLETAVVILSYTLQIYFDFSGYCDMATGIANMLHIDLPLNFNSPYRSLSISDFWKRWHMSLTRFLTSYLYIPLGGSRKGTVRTYLNILIVFAVSGFWHGANWTFILWGVIHGVMQVAYRIFSKTWDRLPAFIRWFMNFILVNLAWVVFRADSISQAFGLIRRLWAGGYSVSGWLVGYFGDFARRLAPMHITIIPTAVSACSMLILLVGGTAVSVFANPVSRELDWKKIENRTWELVLIAFLFFIGVMSLMNPTEFLYWEF